MASFNSSQISLNLKQIPTWFLVGDKISKVFNFPDFKSALKFVNKVGDIAEKLGHHPDISLSWGKVIISTTSHDVKGLTEKDFILAEKIDYVKLTSQPKTWNVIINQVNKVLILSVLAIVTLLCSYIIFNLIQPKTAGQNLITTPSSSPAEPLPTSQTTQRYIIFSPQTFDTANTRRVLFFYASWCPICIPADQDFAANNDQIPSDVTVIRVNYNDPDTDTNEKDLAKKYGITYQHTFVQIDSEGKEITKWNGGKLKELLTNIK